jgi:ketosteroid isomerase-like protein
MKHSFFKLLAVVLVTGLICSCNNEAAKTETAAFNLDSAKAAIAASNKVFGASFATGDSAAFVNLYTSDGCMYPPTMPKMCGPAAITAFFNEGHKGGIANIALTTEEVMGGKDAVVETGKYEVFIANNVSVEKGKFIVVWKEENGKWKMHRDIWNSDAPPPPPPPAK